MAFKLGVTIKELNSENTAEWLINIRGILVTHDCFEAVLEDPPGGTSFTTTSSFQSGASGGYSAQTAQTGVNAGSVDGIEDTAPAPAPAPATETADARAARESSIKTARKMHEKARSIMLMQMDLLRKRKFNRYPPASPSGRSWRRR
jgi:hypothetical protein